MYLSDNLLFVELHKTGGSHIGKLLRQIVPGKQIGKHNIVPSELYDHYILGSIRNPWDWYVSLWAYGCTGEGSVYHQTRQGISLDYYWRQLNNEMGMTWLPPSYYLKQLVSDMRKPTEEWMNTYCDSNNPESFRAWLKLLFSYERRFDIGEGYGFSPLSFHSGLLTYRYLKLFTALGNKIYTNLLTANQEQLQEIWDEYSITSFIIKNENLEDDLISALNAAGVNLSTEQINLINSGRKKKTNKSNHKNTAFYYDAETINLVGSRESFIIQQHNYKPPSSQKNNLPQ